MRIEWAGVVRELEHSPYGWDVRGVNYNVGAIRGGVIEVLIVMFMAAQLSELAHGGVISTLVKIRDPDGRTILERPIEHDVRPIIEQSVFEDIPDFEAAVREDDLDVPPTRFMQPCELTFEVDRPGLYEIELSLDGLAYVFPFVAVEPET